jgi:hypothetical protein
MSRSSKTIRAFLIAGLVTTLSGAAAAASFGAEPGGAPSVVSEGTTFRPALAEANDGDLLASEPFLADPAGSPPRWSARVGAVILQRARPASELFIFEPGSGERLLDPYDMVFPFNGGVDAGLLVRGAVVDVELRYFGAEQSTGTTGLVSLPAGAEFVLAPGDPLTDPIEARLDGSSSLHSAEVNLRRNLTPRFTVLAGLRYLSFRDAMVLSGAEPGDPVEKFLTFGTTNHLYGLQVGADGILWTNGARLRVESALKAGVYANGVGTTLSGTEDDGTPFRFPFGEDHTAFVGDLNFVGVYQMSERWAVRAGYQLLWLTGVATGSTALHGIDFSVDGPPKVITSATVFFHGALVGVERSW